MKLGDLGERGFLERLRARWPELGEDLAIGLGAGDDCAWVCLADGHEGDHRGRVLVSTDALLEGVHFRLEWTDARRLGHKALAVNLSDVAAMGGTPRAFVLVLAAEPSTELAFLDDLYDGMLALARRHRAPLVGGDTCRSAAGLSLQLTVLGTAPEGGPLLRSGARPGDPLLVTGTLGDSTLGLALLEGTLEAPGALADAAAALVERHLAPTPRVEAGRALARGGWARAAIDLSDGLAVDGAHLAAASGVGLRVDPAALPLGDAATALGSELGLDLPRIAAGGGEDYELLVSLRPGTEGAAVAALAEIGVAARIVGHVVEAGEGVRIGPWRPDELSRFEHFPG